MKLRNKKTGEIGEPRIAYQEIYVDTTEHMTHCYQTIAGFFADWEFYIPAEPLIKDEKIRRVIRCLGFEKIAFAQLGVTWRAYDANLAEGFELIIKSKPFDACEDGKIYTIAELCGEEGE